MSDIFSFIIIFIAIMLIVIIIRKSADNQNNNFDERQLILRSNAYKHAFFGVIVYGAGYGLLTALIEKHFMEDGVAAILGFYIGVVIFAVECVMNDAFFSVKNRPALYLALLGITVIADGIGSLKVIKSGTMIQNGILTMNFLQPACAVTLFIVLVTIIIKLLWIRQEEE